MAVSALFLSLKSTNIWKVMQKIVCLLYRIAIFIRQRKLRNKIAKNILQIVEFSFTVWDFISFIYKSGQDKLTTCKDNFSFRQCVLLQFKTKALLQVKSNKKNDSMNSNKQANMSRVPIPIPLRLRNLDKVLEKSKFYKGKVKINFPQVTSSSSFSSLLKMDTLMHKHLKAISIILLKLRKTSLIFQPRRLKKFTRS